MSAQTVQVEAAQDRSPRSFAATAVDVAALTVVVIGALAVVQPLFNLGWVLSVTAAKPRFLVLIPLTAYFIVPGCLLMFLGLRRLSPRGSTLASFRRLLPRLLTVGLAITLVLGIQPIFDATVSSGYVLTDPVSLVVIALLVLLAVVVLSKRPLPASMPWKLALLLLTVGSTTALVLLTERLLTPLDLEPSAFASIVVLDRTAPTGWLVALVCVAMAAIIGTLAWRLFHLLGARRPFATIVMVGGMVASAIYALNPIRELTLTPFFGVPHDLGIIARSSGTFIVIGFVVALVACWAGGSLKALTSTD